MTISKLINASSYDEIVYCSKKLVFSDSNIKKMFEYNFNNNIDVNGNITEYHYKNIPVIVLKLNRNEDSKQIEELYRECNIKPIEIHIYNESSKILSAYESEENYNTLKSVSEFVNYISTNIFKYCNDIIILKKGRFKDFNYLISMLFYYNIRSKFHIESIRNNYNNANYLNNDVNKIKSLIKKIAAY